MKDALSTKKNHILETFIFLSVRGWELGKYTASHYSQVPIRRAVHILENKLSEQAELSKQGEIFQECS